MPVGMRRISKRRTIYLPPPKGKGQNVYIVDAYDNPDVAGDFAAYCKDGPACWHPQQIQPGRPNEQLPSGQSGLGCRDRSRRPDGLSEASQSARSVEANSNAWSDIEAAEEEAVALGGTIVTNSYGGSGASCSDYDTKGVTYLASAGDSGNGIFDPADCASVIAVGGTFLNSAGGKRKYSEIVWTDSGGGCSSQPKPKWQKDPDCIYRTANDAAAVAVNAAEYDTYSEGGWITVDGTSISSPLVAGMVGLAGNSTKQDGGKNLWNAFSKLSFKKQQKDKNIYYISSGSNGQCGGEYLCTAGTGQFGRYSGPTGWGTHHERCPLA